jgi:aerobic carbon-monoxide dehydrogenase medium subunit
MKPAPFAYHRARTAAEVDALLARLGDEAKLLAGGQSLVPMLNMRLATPAHLIDVTALADEPRVPLVGEDGAARIGALVRHAAAERSDALAAGWPIVRQALAHVAHPPIRTRGTVVGSIAHADPAGELPAVLALLDGVADVRSERGRRSVGAAELFAGPLETTLAADEWIEAVRLPPPPPGHGSAVQEFARRHGDYAICGIAATADPCAAGCVEVALAAVSMGPVPVRVALGRVTAAELASEALAERVATAVEDAFAPDDDLHASAAYRRWLALRLGVTAIRQAAAAADHEAAT